MSKGRYFLGRVIKAGSLNQTTLMDAMANSTVISLGKYNWAFTDVIDRRTGPEFKFLYGKLSKFENTGIVTVIDRPHRSQEEATIPDLLVASAPFIYLPEYSGICFLHVWNHIQQEMFERRFCQIVKATHSNFFVDCSIEPIADYRKFQIRVSELDNVFEIRSKVHPPNPLYGRFWKPLKEYIERRNASVVTIEETSDSG